MKEDLPVFLSSALGGKGATKDKFLHTMAALGGGGGNKKGGGGLDKEEAKVREEEAPFNGSMMQSVSVIIESLGSQPLGSRQRDEDE